MDQEKIEGGVMFSKKKKPDQEKTKETKKAKTKSAETSGSKSNEKKETENLLQSINKIFSDDIQEKSADTKNVFGNDSSLGNLPAVLKEAVKNIKTDDIVVLHNMNGIFKDVKRIQKRFTDPQGLLKHGVKDMNHLLNTLEKRQITFDDIYKLELVKQTEHDLLSIKDRMNKIAVKLDLKEEEQSKFDKALAEVGTLSKKINNKVMEAGGPLISKLLSKKKKLDEVSLRREFRADLKSFAAELDKLDLRAKTKPILKLKAIADRAHEILKRNGTISGQVYRDQIQDISQLYADAATLLDKDFLLGIPVSNKLKECIIRFSDHYYHPAFPSNDRDFVITPLALQDEWKETDEIVSDFQKGQPNPLKNIFAVMHEKYKTEKELKGDSSEKNILKKFAQEIGFLKKAGGEAIEETSKPPLMPSHHTWKAEATLLLSVNRLQQSLKIELIDKDHQTNDPKNLEKDKDKFLYLTRVLYQINKEKNTSSSKPGKLAALIHLENQIYAIAQQNDWINQSGSLYLMQQARSYDAKKDFTIGTRLRETAKNMCELCYTTKLDKRAFLKMSDTTLIPNPDSKQALTERLDRYRGAAFSAMKNSGKDIWRNTKTHIANKVPSHVLRHMGLESLAHLKTAIKIEINQKRADNPDVVTHTRRMKA